MLVLGSETVVESRAKRWPLSVNGLWQIDVTLPLKDSIMRPLAIKILIGIDVTTMNLNGCAQNRRACAARTCAFDTTITNNTVDLSRGFFGREQVEQGWRERYFKKTIEAALKEANVTTTL